MRKSGLVVKTEDLRIASLRKIKQLLFSAESLRKIKQLLFSAESLRKIKQLFFSAESPPETKNYNLFENFIPFF